MARIEHGLGLRRWRKRAGSRLAQQESMLGAWARAEEPGELGKCQGQEQALVWELVRER